MNRGQMQEVMVLAFINHITPYMEKDWVEPSSYKGLYNFACTWIFGKTSPSMNWNGIWVSVDFECGAGSKVGSPTSTRSITVFYKDRYERFTRRQLINKAYERLNKIECVDQLALF